MTDTEILNWLQSNCIEIREPVPEVFTIKWLDEFGYPVETSGESLRDCVEKACKPTE